MLDFARWVEAGGGIFRWQPGQFIDALNANQREASAAIVEGSFVGRFVPLLAKEGFEGTAADCLTKLAMVAGTAAVHNRAWPATPRGLVGILRRLGPSFRVLGIAVGIERRAGEHQISIGPHRAAEAEVIALPLEG